MKIYKNILYFIIIISFANCKSDGKSIDAYSFETKNFKDKIELLEEYISAPTTIIDAEYYIHFQDNSTGMVPGPSDYYMLVALKIKEGPIEEWYKDLTLYDNQLTFEEWKKLKLDKNIWNLNTEYQIYRSNSRQEIVVVFPKEKIVLATYSSMPINFKTK